MRTVILVCGIVFHAPHSHIHWQTYCLPQEYLVHWRSSGEGRWRIGRSA